MPRPEPKADPIREGIAQAMREIAQAGGVVLVGYSGQPFAFYPPRVVTDPGAPERLRRIWERRLGRVGPDPGAPGRLREAVERRIEEMGGAGPR